jgi:uncharacterized membrane protein YqjE
MSVRSAERDAMNVHATDGIVRSGRRMLAILVNMARTRLNLLAVELMEEKTRIWLMLVLTGLALIFASMALLMLSLLVVVAFWDDNRLLAIGGLLAFYVLATAAALLVLRQKARVGSKLFAHSLRELQQDETELEGELELGEPDVGLRPSRRRG